jgi:hypothetical protein
VNNTPPVIAVVGEGPDGAYEGNSLYVVTPATVVNGESPVIEETQWFSDGIGPVFTGSIFTIPENAVGEVFTARQLFKDDRDNELLSEPSNGITIVERPADAITFTAVITDDGTPEGNQFGHVLTAAAENIEGGTAPAARGGDPYIGDRRRGNDPGEPGVDGGAVGSRTDNGGRR